MQSVSCYLVELIKTINALLLNGFDIFETFICIAGIAAIVLIIWVVVGAVVKILASLFEIIREITRSLESVLKCFFYGVKVCFKKLNEFGRQED
jgi:ABC-type polysaccharide/polyol phosphate export permease